MTQPASIDPVGAMPSWRDRAPAGPHSGGTKPSSPGAVSGRGSTAAIASAREGADVAINHFPSEQPGACKVIERLLCTARSVTSPYPSA